jgi:hypothetical protein
MHQNGRLCVFRATNRPKIQGLGRANGGAPSQRDSSLSGTRRTRPRGWIGSPLGAADTIRPGDGTQPRSVGFVQDKHFALRRLTFAILKAGVVGLLVRKSEGGLQHKHVRGLM